MCAGEGTVRVQSRVHVSRGVDVDDVEQWADGIVSILEDDEHRARLAMQGALRAEGFGPEVAASRLVDTWRACC